MLQMLSWLWAFLSERKAFGAGRNASRASRRYIHSAGVVSPAWCHSERSGSSALPFLQVLGAEAKNLSDAVLRNWVPISALFAHKKRRRDSSPNGRLRMTT